MLKVKKYGAEFNIPKSSLVKIDAAYDGIIITLFDNTEIRFTMSVSPQIKAIMPIINQTTSDIVVLDLDAATSGQYDRVITLENRPPVVQTVQIKKSKSENVDKKDNKKTSKLKFPISMSLLNK